MKLFDFKNSKEKLFCDCKLHAVRIFYIRPKLFRSTNFQAWSRLAVMSENLVWRPAEFVQQL